MDTTNAIGLSLILEKAKEFYGKSIYYILEEVEKITGEFFSTNEGASRTVISHESWDFVLKINTYEYEEEDVNAREECNYISAKEYEVEDFLLPVEKFYCEGTLEFYIQPKITSIYSRTMLTSTESSSWDIYRDRASEKDFISYVGYLNRMPNDFLRICIGYYGAEFMERVCEWAVAQKVNDLHGSNVGFYHGRPVLFDYAGFFG